MNNFKYLLLALFASTLIGCGSNVKESTADNSTVKAVDNLDEAALRQAEEDERLAVEEALAIAEDNDSNSNEGQQSVSSLGDATIAELMSSKIYFDYDSSFVKNAFQDIVDQHIDYMIDFPDAILQLHGHCDERGSQAYNLALGDRRGNAIKEILVTNGISGDRIKVISFGETRPVDYGHDSVAWSLNRRVEFLYE